MPSPSSENAFIKLSVGDVVTAGLRVYRDHFRPYFLQALTAYLWIVVAFVLSILVILLIVGLGAFMGETAVIGLGVLSGLGLLIPWAYCLAKFNAAQAVLARVVFYEVEEQPESLAAARIQLMPRFWRFLWANLIVSICLFMVFGAYALITVILSFGIVASGLSGDAGATAAILLMILLFSWIFFGGFLYLWVFSRLALADACLAMEPTLSPLNAVNRSWQLTKGYVVSLQLIFFIAFLITVPLSIISNFGSFLALGLGLSEEVATILNTPLSVAIGALLIPFWQAIKAVIYYDLRIRKEGVNLSLDVPTDRLDGME